MQAIAIFIVKLTLLFVFCGNCFAGEIDALVEKTKAHFANNEIYKIPDLFIIPDFYTTEQKLAEKQDLEILLAQMAVEFGYFSDFEPSQDRTKCYFFEISSGTEEFQDSIITHERFKYKTTYSRLGNGFFYINVNNDGTPKIKSIVYAVPGTRENKIITRKIAERFYNLDHPEPKK